MPDPMQIQVARATLTVRAAALALTGAGIEAKLVAAVMMSNAVVMAVAAEGESAAANALRLLAAKIEAGAYSLAEIEADAAALVKV